MFDRLDDLLIRYEELMEELGSPEVASDTNRFDDSSVFNYFYHSNPFLTHMLKRNCSVPSQSRQNIFSDKLSP